MKWITIGIAPRISNSLTSFHTFAVCQTIQSRQRDTYHNYSSHDILLYLSISGRIKTALLFAWHSRLQTILKEYESDIIYNADETGLFYRLLPDKTLEFKSKICHGGKQSKERLTVMVCANMTGTHKLPLLVIGKSVKPCCFKNVKSLPSFFVILDLSLFFPSLFH